MEHRVDSGAVSHRASGSIRRRLTVAVLNVAEHCARGTSSAGDAEVAAGYVLNVERTVTKVAMDTSLSKLNSILAEDEGRGIHENGVLKDVARVKEMGGDVGKYCKVRGSFKCSNDVYFVMSTVLRRRYVFNTMHHMRST